MTFPVVSFLGRNLLEGVIEGHHVASLNIINAAVEAGIESKIVTISRNAGVNVSVKGAKFYLVKSRVDNTIVKSQTFCFEEARSCVRAMFQMKVINPDLIHYLNVTKEIALIAQTLAGVHKPRVAHFFHSAFAFEHRAFKLRPLFIKMRLFDKILSTNRSLMYFLLKRLGVDKKNIDYVPIPIDTNRFKIRNTEKLREQYNLHPDTPIIVYVGAIYPDRGIFVLLEAFREVLKQIPEAFMFVFHSRLSGDEEIYAPLFYNLTKRKELQGHVILHGPFPKIEEAYNLANVVVLPFTQPYWITDPPLVLLEAMASGAPIITTPVGAITEMATHNENAYFAKPASVSSLVKAILWMLNNRDAAIQLGINARKEAEKVFAIAKVGKQLRSIYEGIPT